MAVIQVKSSTFKDGAAIPAKHAYKGEGQNVSPEIAWEGAPPKTGEFALICDDPDAPRPTPWVHWVVYNIPAGTAAIPEGGLKGVLEGRNDFGEKGWGGPMPPKGHGVHHYHFTVYALEGKHPMAPGLSKDELLAAIRDRVVATGKLIGTYERR
ncbi:MAG: YbhB/YbcL family Raf kinase inhibitor-like protein [Candidatus Wallbacteria bacterium]|nr:YbhB/YbcL family Raf kinase inhibitor-like protein [Candidatus Wallbacteria bacterium]